MADREEGKSERDYFVCLEERCGGKLEVVATSPIQVGLACGDDIFEEYYACTSCKQTYSREHHTIGAWNPFSFEENQQYIERCESIPDDAERRSRT